MQGMAAVPHPQHNSKHPLTQLLECPPETSQVLGESARSLQFDEGECVFRQDETCAGLYLLVSGSYARRADRMGMHMLLSTGAPGELVELAAALGDKRHTYTLVAKTTGSALLLPLVALENAFRQYPPLRMHLLEELAREVSRAYGAVWLLRMSKLRRARAV